MKGRKSNKIKVLTLRDKKLLKQLANTGICSIEQAKTFCNINRNRLINLEKAGFIKINKNAGTNTKLMETVKLNSKGRNFCENNMNQKAFYKTTPAQINHDLKLTETYYQILKKHPEAQWKNETQLRLEYSDCLIDNKDCIDGAVFFPNGDSWGIESVGSKYTKQTIENKISVGNKIANQTFTI